MRVLFLTPSLYLGGAERWLLSLCKHFSPLTTAAGIVHCGPLALPELVREANRVSRVHQVPISIVDQPRKPPQVTCYARDAQATVRGLAEDCDVVVSWGISALADVTRDLTLPVVEVSHGDAAWDMQRALLARSHTGATHLAAVSRGAAEAYPEQVRGRVEVIYNGADVERCAPSGPDGRRRQRDQWGVSDDERVLLYVGRFDPVKGPERLIGAARQLPPEWKLVYCGKGVSDLKGELRRAAAQQLPGRAVFAEAKTAIGDVLAAADCVCVPSRHEGMSLVVLEAMLAGRPLVTTKYRAVEELQRRHGPLFPLVPQAAGDAVLAKAILHAAQGGQVERARRVAWENYTAGAMARRWETYLARVVAQYRTAWLDGRPLEAAP